MAIFSALAVASCILIRDFDELQEGGEPTGGTAGTAGAAGTAGTAGSAGASCEVRCDDDDACTRDTCDLSGACRHYSLGAVHDGLSQTLSTGNAQAVTLAANDLGFYAAVTFGSDTDSTVSLYSFSRADTELIAGPSVTEPQIIQNALLRAVPEAAVVLVAEDNPPTYPVTAYAALTNAPAGTALDEGSLAHVWRINLDGDLQLAATAPAWRISHLLQDDYVVGQRGPIAWELGGKKHVAWIGANGTINVSSEGDGLRTLDNGGAAITVIAPLGDNNGNPAVLWFSADDPPTVYGQLVDSLLPASALDTCPGDGIFFAADTAMLNQDMWVGTWTRVVLDSGNVVDISGEAQMVGCSQILGCGVISRNCGDQPGEPLENRQPRSGMFEAVIASTTSQAEPGVFYEALFFGQLLSETEAAGYLQAFRIDFGNQYGSLMLFPGEGLEVVPPRSAEGVVRSTAAEFSGDRLAIAWIETDEDTDLGEAHFERYRICPLTDDDLAVAAASNP